MLLNLILSMLVAGCVCLCMCACVCEPIGFAYVMAAIEINFSHSWWLDELIEKRRRRRRRQWWCCCDGIKKHIARCSFHIYQFQLIWLLSVSHVLVLLPLLLEWDAFFHCAISVRQRIKMEFDGRILADLMSGLEGANTNTHTHTQSLYNRFNRME